MPSARTIRSPSTLWVWTTLNSSSVRAAGFKSTRSGTAILPTSCRVPAIAIRSMFSIGSSMRTAIAVAYRATRSEWLRVYRSLASTASAKA